MPEEAIMAVESAVAVQSWDHSVVPVMDLWRAERFYTELLDGVMFQKIGMTYEWASGAKGTGNLGTFVKLGRSHLGLFLQSQLPVERPASPDAPGPCWGIGVAADAFDALVARLAAAGATLAPARELRLGAPRSRPVRPPQGGGSRLELVAAPRGPYGGQIVPALTHLRPESRALAASAAFYQRFLGATVVD